MEYKEPGSLWRYYSRPGQTRGDEIADRWDPVKKSPVKVWLAQKRSGSNGTHLWTSEQRKSSEGNDWKVLNVNFHLLHKLRDEKMKSAVLQLH